MSSTAPPPRLRQNAAYLLWLTGDTAKGLSTALYSFALPLITLAATNDPAQAGTIAGIGMAVRVMITLAGGVLADRHSRIRLLLIGAAAATVVAAGFTALALADSLTFTTLLAVSVLLSARAGAFEPASESALKSVVPEESIGRAQAANQARDAALQLTGGPLGGTLLIAGAWLVGTVMTIGYAVATILAAILARSRRGSLEYRSPTTSAPRSSAWRELREGLRWLFSRPDLRGVLLVTTTVNLGFTAAVTTVVYGLQQDGHTAVTIGWVSAGAGVAMLVGALVASTIVSRVGTGPLTVTGLSVVAVGTAALALTSTPWALVGILGASVALLPSVNAALMGYFMVATPSRLLGRANSASSVLAMGAMPFGPLIAGFGLAGIGRGGTILFSAALCALSALLAVRSRALRALPMEPRWAAHAAQFTRGAGRR